MTTRVSRQFTLAFTRERLQSGRFLLFLWFAARLLIFFIWAFISPASQGDVVYYFQRIQVLFNQGAGQTLQEYPTPVIWLLALPYLLGFGHQQAYVVAFALIMLGLDALFTWSLWRTGGAMKGQAVVFWTLFLLLVGPTAYLRFDLVTSVLAGWSLILLLRRRSASAGFLTAVAASVKLWPALLWPALMPGPRRQKLRATIGFVAGGVLLVAVSLVYAGWDRLLSPLSWQQGRGLQIESVWATVPMLARAFHAGDYIVTLSPYQAYEIWGPGVQVLIKASDAAFVIGLLAAMLCYVIWLWRGHGRIIESVALVELIVLVMIITNKTFSPQYMIWLGGPEAAAFAVLGTRTHHARRFHADRTRINNLSVWILIATGLTLLVYPLSYDMLVSDWNVRDSVMRVPATLILVARNVALIGVLIQVIRWAWSFLGPSALRAARHGRESRVGADEDIEHPDTAVGGDLNQTDES
ncbi:glycosyltransferase 87 family protein [Propionibacterium sp.]|uniref:glycosyltransferase 87 family protein n=1 Tax=Propionibacterium sp. TaxID=1977903 RepID=UPI0039EBAA7E